MKEERKEKKENQRMRKSFLLSRVLANVGMDKLLLQVRYGIFDLSHNIDNIDVYFAAKKSVRGSGGFSYSVLTTDGRICSMLHQSWDDLGSAVKQVIGCRKSCSEFHSDPHCEIDIGRLPEEAQDEVLLGIAKATLDRGAAWSRVCGHAFVPAARSREELEIALDLNGL